MPAVVEFWMVTPLIATLVVAASPLSGSLSVAQMPYWLLASVPPWTVTVLVVESFHSSTPYWKPETLLFWIVAPLDPCNDCSTKPALYPPEALLDAKLLSRLIVLPVMV